MAIEDLRDSDGLIASGLHPRIAVLNADAGQRARALAALGRVTGAVVLDAAMVVDRLSQDRERLKAVRAEAVAPKEARVAELRNARHAAGEQVVAAFAAVESALGSLDGFDKAERTLVQALTERNQATRAEAVEARRLVAVLERRERLTEQRDVATRAVQELEEGGPVRRSADMRDQVAQMAAGLARAEFEQTRAERAAEATLHQARQVRLAAELEVEGADRILRADLPGFPHIPADGWPPGPPLPALVAERRNRLAAALADLYSATTSARAALDAVTEDLRAAERELAEARKGGVASAVSAALEDLLTRGVEGGRSPGSGRVLVCDDPFVGMEPPLITPVLERLVEGGSLQIVYLTDDISMLSWARSLPPGVGGVTDSAPALPSTPASPPAPAPPTPAAHISTSPATGTTPRPAPSPLASGLARMTDADLPSSA